MEKPYVFVISDVHGQLALFEALLKDYDSQLHQLVLIGDLNDRGPHTKECLLLGQQLVEREGAVYLCGNHEEYFLHFLADPENYYSSYLRNGGKETIESLLHQGATEEYSPTEMALMIRSRYKELLEFLGKRPLYFQWANYIFVHAGVDLTKTDWKETSPHDFLWIREPFHQGQNKTGKTIVFGHTITPSLYGDLETTRLWISDHKIGIDGGGVFGGSVHGVIFDKVAIVQDIEYQNLTGPWRPDF